MSSHIFILQMNFFKFQCNHKGKSSSNFTFSLPIGSTSMGVNLIFQQLTPQKTRVMLCLFTILPLSMFPIIKILN
jgi:hypothetical protein